MKRNGISLLASMLIPAWALWGQTLPPFDLQPTSTIANNIQSFRFGAVEVQSAPPVNWDPGLTDGGDPNNPADDPYCRILFCTGDGNYYIINGLENLDTVNYIYATAGAVTAYMEVAAIYDKDKKKANFSYAPVNIGLSGTNSTSIIDGMTDALAITTIRSPMVGEIMTYIISYKNINNIPTSGEITITYDPGQLKKPDQTTGPHLADFYHDEQLIQKTGTGGQDTIKLQYTGLDIGERRNMILHFIADSTAESICLKASLPTGTPRPVEVIVCLQLVDSHDPNLKMNQSVITTARQSVEYDIIFQNTGNGNANRVEIRDELDLAVDAIRLSDLTIEPDRGLEIASTTLLPVRTGLPGSNHTAYELNIVANTTNPPLRGTADQNFGHAFGVDATIRKIRVQARVKPEYSSACGVIFNAARICFDDNLPIETAIEPAPVDSCSPCIQKQKTIYREITRSGPFSNRALILPGTDTYTELNELRLKEYRFRWYPASLTADPFSFDTETTTERSANFALVASKGCERRVYYVNVSLLCPFAIEAPEVVEAACFERPAERIRVSPAGDYALNRNLRWSTGAAGNASILLGPLYAGVHYIGLTDTRTGCSVQKEIRVAAPPRLVVEDNPKNCTADLFVSGGTPPYRYHWKNTRKPVPEHISSRVKFKTGMSVAVTDSKGCSNTFYPQCKTFWCKIFR